MTRHAIANASCPYIERFISHQFRKSPAVVYAYAQGFDNTLYCATELVSNSISTDKWTRPFVHLSAVSVGASILWRAIFYFFKFNGIKIRDQPMDTKFCELIIRKTVRSIATRCYILWLDAPNPIARVCPFCPRAIRRVRLWVQVEFEWERSGAFGLFQSPVYTPLNSLPDRLRDPTPNSDSFRGNYLKRGIICEFLNTRNAVEDASWFCHAM